MNTYQGPAVLTGGNGVEIDVEANLENYHDPPLRGWRGVVHPLNDEEAVVTDPVKLRIPGGGEADVTLVGVSDGIELQGSGKPPWL